MIRIRNFSQFLKFARHAVKTKTMPSWLAVLEYRQNVDVTMYRLGQWSTTYKRMAVTRYTEDNEFYRTIIGKNLNENQISDAYGEYLVKHWKDSNTRLWKQDKAWIFQDSGVFHIDPPSGEWMFSQGVLP